MFWGMFCDALLQTDYEEEQARQLQ